MGCNPLGCLMFIHQYMVWEGVIYSCCLFCHIESLNTPMGIKRNQVRRKKLVRMTSALYLGMWRRQTRWMLSVAPPLLRPSTISTTTSRHCPWAVVALRALSWMWRTRIPETLLPATSTTIPSTARVPSSQIWSSMVCPCLRWVQLRVLVRSSQISFWGCLPYYGPFWRHIPCLCRFPYAVFGNCALWDKEWFNIEGFCVRGGVGNLNSNDLNLDMPS